MADELTGGIGLPEGGDGAPPAAPEPLLLEGAPDFARGMEEAVQRQIIAAGYKTVQDLANGYINSHSTMDRTRSEKEELERAYLELLEGDDDGDEEYGEPPAEQDFSAFNPVNWDQEIQARADPEGDVSIADVAGLNDWRSTQRDLAIFQTQQAEIARLEARLAALESSQGPIVGEYTTQTQSRVENEMQSVYGDQFPQLQSAVNGVMNRYKAQNPGWIPTSEDWQNQYRMVAGQMYEEERRRAQRSAAASSQGPGSGGQGTGLGPGAQPKQDEYGDMVAGWEHFVGRPGI